MKGFVDRISGCTLFTDAVKLTYKEFLIGIEVPKISSSGGIDESLIGGNASAECQQEQYEDQAQSKPYYEEFDIQKGPEMEPKLLKLCIGRYLKKLMKTLQEDSCDEVKERVQIWKTSGGGALKEFMSLYNPDNADIFAHCSLDYDNPNSPIFIGVWDDDGGLTLWTFRDCFTCEKY